MNELGELDDEEVADHLEDPGVPEYSIERTATIMWLLCEGGKYTTREIMTLTNMSRQGVWYHMGCITRARVPVTQIDGRWQIVRKRDAQEFWGQEKVERTHASR